jgi:peptidoglycan/xylan/chitin deacetylase (PgdA/CDA1 family)
VVALTFDAGSDRGNAEQILDLLADEGIQASFGLTGQWAEANPDLVRRMGEAGHTLINHTYDHPHMETLSTTERISELDATESIVSGLTGRSTKPYFRPPFGSYDEQVLDDAGSIGYRFAIMWTVDSLGWKGIPADQVVARCIDGAESGAIFPLHVGSASTDYNALPELIAHLRAAGYGFATIAQLVP